MPVYNALVNFAGLLYVVDSSDRDRIAESRAELHGILDDIDMQGVPFVVLANKQDMPNAMSPAQLIDNLGLHKYNGRHEWNVQATCAVTGEGIYEAMDTVSKLVKQRESWSSETLPEWWMIFCNAGNVKTKKIDG